MPWNTFEIVWLFVLIFCFIAQMLFYWIVVAKPFQYMKSIASMEFQQASGQPPVSVIVSIKNSQPDWKQSLQDILEQDYPAFEVIAVTDKISYTNEDELIRMKNRYPNLYTTHVPEDTKNVSRKKLALTLGIKAAKYELLLFTECDCHTRSKDWISLMSSHFSDKKTVVLGFAAFENPSGLRYNFATYDYFFSNLQMISFALFNHPYSGNGRNMAYSKKHFIKHKGFIKYRTLQQGEDDLFINEIATDENTAIELSPQSVTLTEINENTDWRQFKLDRMSTQRFYQRGPVAFHRLEAGIRITFYTALVFCFFSGGSYASFEDFLLPGTALVCFIARFVSQLFIINKINDLLQLKKFYLELFFFDLFQPFVNLYFFMYSVLKRQENYTYRYEK